MSKELQKLKCGGKKKKKFHDGSISPIPTSQIKMPQLAPKIDTTTLAPMAKNAVGGLDFSAIPFQQLGNVAGNYADELISGLATGPTDVRENPLLKTLKRDQAGTAGDIVGNTLKGAGAGAAIGSVIPGLGTVVGGAIGAGLAAAGTGLKKLLESPEKKRQRIEASQKWNSQWVSLYNQGMAQEGYKDGGSKGPDYTGMGIDFMKLSPEERRKISVNHMRTALVPLDPNTPKVITGAPPVAGIIGKVGQVASAYRKLNYFRPDANMMYRGLGVKGAENAFKTGVFRSAANPRTGVIPAETYFAPSTEMKIVKEYGGKYIAEVPKSAANFQRTYPTKEWSQYTTDVIPITKGRILKKDFLSGYKEISAPKYKDGGIMLKTKRPVEIDEMTEGYAKGGKVNGAGTAKSDSITKKVQDGSFIVPAENAGKAMSYGKAYLGWKEDEQANRNYPGSQVKLSNGEVLFTPEEVEVLGYHGIDLSALAPNATQSIEEGGEFKDGTEGPFTTKPTFEEYAAWYKSQYPGSDDNAAMGGYEAAFPAEQAGQAEQTNQAGDTDVTKPTFMNKVLGLAPEMAGLLQTGFAISADRKAGSMPDINVTAELKSLTREARKAAEYGLEPSARNAMANAAEEERRNAANTIISRGGSSAEIMSNLQGILSTATSKKQNIELMDVQEKARKQGRVDQLTTTLSGQEMDVQKEALRTWRDVQEVNASLLNAGISNIIGARKLKNEMQLMGRIKEGEGVTVEIGGKKITLK